MYKKRLFGLIGIKILKPFLQSLNCHVKNEKITP